LRLERQPSRRARIQQQRLLPHDNAAAAATALKIKANNLMCFIAIFSSMRDITFAAASLFTICGKAKAREKKKEDWKR
jgi:hypothetical protein